MIGAIAIQARRRRRFVVPAAVCLLMLVVLCTGRSVAGVGLLALLLLALLLTVRLHLRLRRVNADESRLPARSLLQSPAQVAAAVAVFVCLGGLATIVSSVVLAAIAPALVGDGSSLVRALLVVFVLGPCFSIGYRCGRWWAFAGGAGIAPVLGLCIVLVGPRSSSGLDFLAVAVLAIAFAVATGSLRHELAEAHVRPGRKRSPAAVGRREPTGAEERRSATA